MSKPRRKRRSRARPPCAYCFDPQAPGRRRALRCCKDCLKLKPPKADAALDEARRILAAERAGAAA